MICYLFEFILVIVLLLLFVVCGGFGLGDSLVLSIFFIFLIISILGFINVVVGDVVDFVVVLFIGYVIVDIDW